MLTDTELLSIIAGIICSQREVRVEKAVELASQIVVEAYKKSDGLNDKFWQAASDRFDAKHAKDTAKQ